MSDLFAGYQTWACGYCDARGEGGKAEIDAHRAATGCRPPMPDSLRVEILARALNEIQRSAWLQPRSGLEERMRQTAIDALDRAGMERWT